jgi:hypothetical protein
MPCQYRFLHYYCESTVVFAPSAQTSSLRIAHPFAPSPRSPSQPGKCPASCGLIHSQKFPLTPDGETENSNEISGQLRFNSRDRNWLLLVRVCRMRFMLSIRQLFVIAVFCAQVIEIIFALQSSCQSFYVSHGNQWLIRLNEFHLFAGATYKWPIYYLYIDRIDRDRNS